MKYEMDIKNSLVIHLIKCTDDSIVASGRIAKFISKSLDIPIFDSPDTFPGIKTYDYIFLVNSPGLFSNILPEVIDLCYFAKKIIFVRNDYHSDLNEPSQIKRMLLGQHRWGNYFSTIPEHHVFVEGDAYINWNMLTWNPIPFNEEEREKGLFYYGAFRGDRKKYFEKYFVDAPYKITISSTKGSGKKFVLLNDKIKIVEPYKSFEDIGKYKATIYIEDKSSNKVYCSPANRFYECLSAGIAIFFDESAKKTFEEAGYDISPYIVRSKEELSERLKAWKTVAKTQRDSWGSKNYAEELSRQFNNAVKKLKQFDKFGGVQKMPSKNTRKNMPSPDLLVDKTNLKDFFYWMFERQNIWHKRFAEKKARPWTEDKILNDYKFTNVYRELDRNTVWLIDNVIKKKMTPKDMLWRIIVFRYFNKPELFDFMGGVPGYADYSEKRFNKKVQEYAEKHGRVFTDAYMINPPKDPEDRKLGIELFYCKHIAILHNKMSKRIWAGYETTDAKGFNTLLKKELHCIADFLAYEIYCDCCYTNWFKWNENDFVNVGPGAKFGLELLFPFLHETRDYTRFLYFLKNKSNAFFKKFGYDMKFYNAKNPKDFKKGKGMTLRTIEHSLCEFSKFWKMRLNVGKPRQKFVPKTKIK